MKQSQMTDIERDAVYTELCQAVTAVGTTNESLFLARLALLLLEKNSDMSSALRLIEEAKEGMDETGAHGPRTGEF
jgi:hypothetical protein